MKNIIFDLGGVLLKGEPSSILNKIKISKDDYNLLIKFFYDWKPIDLGIQTLEEKFIECNYSEYISSKYKNILIKYYEIRDINMDLIELIKILKHNNYNIYILSDNNIECSNYYKNNKLFNNIDGWIISCDYNTLKSDGKLFKILLDKYKLNPNESYFIDNKQINIDIAKKYNIKGYKFDENCDINKLYNDMKNNGINI